MTKIEAVAAVTFKGIERRRLNFRGSSRGKFANYQKNG